jgi:protein gp37
MNKTGISWTDLTWNPVSGCTKVSPGCQNCYAEAWAKRWHRSFEVTLHPEKLREVEKIPAGSKVFVNSMSDLFHPDVPTSFINNVFLAIRRRPDVVFQILTKRPEQIKLRENEIFTIPDNVWLGVSVEMPLYVERIDELVNVVHNGIKWISFEPLLSDMGQVGFKFEMAHGIDWVVIGGESGPRHRPMKIEWAANIIREAKRQGVSIWMKQLGGLRPGGELEDFPEELRIREFPPIERWGMKTYKYKLVVEIDGRRELYNTLEEAVKRARKEGYYVVERGSRPDREPHIVRLLYKNRKLADAADQDYPFNEGEIIRVDC